MFTDHKPLLGLFLEVAGLPARSASRVLRWAVLLSGYDYELKYRPDLQNGNADILSRLPMIYIFIHFKSECPYNKFTVIERILGNLQNSYIETGAHKIRLIKYSTKNLKSKSKIPNK